MRSPISRRSASICVSPGPPRKPKPPRWRSRWVQDRTRRERWYSRCASSTCSAPSRGARRARRRCRGSGRCGRSPCRPRRVPGCAAAPATARHRRPPTVTSCSAIACALRRHLSFAEQGRRAADAQRQDRLVARPRGRSRRPARPPRPAGPRPHALASARLPRVRFLPGQDHGRAGGGPALSRRRRRTGHGPIARSAAQPEPVLAHRSGRSVRRGACPRPWRHRTAGSGRPASRC